MSTRRRSYAEVHVWAHAEPAEDRAGNRTVVVRGEYRDGDLWSATTTLHLTEAAARCLLAELRTALTPATDAPYLVN